VTETRVFSNRYEILRPIARGGMADVYLARDLQLDRPVALKVLFPELSADPNFVARFRREAQAAANLNHPNIVAIYDWGEEGSTYFIVMEYIEGRTLREVLRSEGPLLPERAADIAADIAAALAFAHRNGVIHRDVKPGNVLITATGQVKVTDFGIARAVTDGAAESLTQTGTVMGTATYFSPEQAQGAPVDQRSDVYSLGVVLYEMVTGRPPFVGDNPVAIAYQHVQEAPLAPSRINPDVPPALEAIIGRALAKSPDARYPSAAALRNDLIAFCDGRGVEAVAAARTALNPRVSASTQVQQAYTAATRTTPAVGGAGAGPGAPASPRGPRTGAYVALLVALLAVLGVLLFLLYRQFSGDGGGGATLAVPNVVTRPVAEAVQALRDAGLSPATEEVPNDQVAPGVVFDQDPPAGTRVKRGATVRLKVSAGAPPVSVPAVVGTALDDARDVLSGAGLAVDVRLQPSDTEPAGQVLAQEPAAGTAVPRGTTVTLTVSSGKPKVAVPDVAGKDATEAANILGQQGFRVRTQREPSDTVAEGTVIRTDPPAGSDADKGSTVTIVVSSGPADVEVPSVVGMTQADATAALEAAGFQVVVQNQTVVDAADVGRVIDQSPNAGTRAPRGSTVTITVGKALGG
jgi:serine/threonine-protein kinase